MNRQIIPYNPKLKELARKLRSEATWSERILWKYLRNKQLRGYDFHRQKPLTNFIVDFFCSELMLVIEIDGISYNGRLREDKARQKKLESLGIKFLRFDDLYIKQNIQGVLITIDSFINQFENRHTPNPSQEGN